MKRTYKILIIILVIAALAGCGQAAATPAAITEADTQASAPPAGGQRGELEGVDRLALGTLQLEGTTDAVTMDQARELLPLWQIIQGGALKSAAETDAVTKQIEQKMTASQLAAIEAMALTPEAMQAWLAEQGIEMPAPQGDGQGGGPAGPGALGDLSEEERAKMREQLQNMSAEDRATRTAEMGAQRPVGQEGAVLPGAGRGIGQSTLVIGPLVELLTARAAG